MIILTHIEMILKNQNKRGRDETPSSFTKGLMTLPMIGTLCFAIPPFVLMEAGIDYCHIL